MKINKAHLLDIVTKELEFLDYASNKTRNEKVVETRQRWDKFTEKQEATIESLEQLAARLRFLSKGGTLLTSNQFWDEARNLGLSGQYSRGFDWSLSKMDLEDLNRNLDVLDADTPSWIADAQREYSALRDALLMVEDEFVSTYGLSKLYKGHIPTGLTNFATAWHIKIVNP